MSHIEPQRHRKKILAVSCGLKSITTVRISYDNWSKYGNRSQGGQETTRQADDHLILGRITCNLFFFSNVLWKIKKHGDCMQRTLSYLPRVYS
jgi:hypothetical protein